jgi:hypothetical protein
MTGDDFRRIRWSIVLLLTMVGLGAGIVYFAHGKAEEKAQELQAARSDLEQIRAKLTRARDEEAEIRARIARFDELARAGVVGGEQRLQWVERIKAISASRGLFPPQYEIAPQRPLDAAIAPKAAGSYEFFSSRMRLKFDLLHEGDLFNFLDDLRNGVRAYVRPERCSIERKAGNPGGDRQTAAQLKAECAVDLITVKIGKPEA